MKKRWERETKREFRTDDKTRVVGYRAKETRVDKNQGFICVCVCRNGRPAVRNQQLVSDSVLSRVALQTNSNVLQE